MSRPLAGPLDGRAPREAARVAGEAMRTVRFGAPREAARVAADRAEVVRERLRLPGALPRRRPALPKRRVLTGRWRLHLEGKHLEGMHLKGMHFPPGRVRTPRPVERIASRVERRAQVDWITHPIAQSARGLANSTLGVVGRPSLPGRNRASLPPSARSALRIALGAAIAAAASWTAIATFLVWWRGRIDEGDRPADAVVVLGAAQRDGVPSRVFAARLDHAVELMQRGAAPHLIVTGGADTPGGSSEADVARAYAVARGVPAEAILAETGGHSTLESLRNVALLMQEHGLGRAILVSDRTHMLRSLLIARRLGMQAVGSPTRTSPADRQLSARLRATRHEIGALAGLAIRGLRI